MMHRWLALAVVACSLGCSLANAAPKSLAKAAKASSEAQPCGAMMAPLTTKEQVKTSKLMVGKFKGTCEAGDKSTFPVETELVSLSDGWMSGSYIMHLQGDGRQEGTLLISSIKGRDAKFTWKDKYGTGTLSVTFNKDFSDFTGSWSNSNSKGGGAWSGHRETGGLK